MNLLEKWLDYRQCNTSFTFRLVRITEKHTPDTEIIEYLQEKLLTSYRSLEFYQFHLGAGATEEEIKQYVVEKVVPKNENLFDKSVRQGDWGEILATMIVSYFQGLIVPINKLQWKFNKDKAVFGTDLVAFDNAGAIKDIYYYEVKTRTHPNNKEGTHPNRFYISVIAHNSLLNHDLSPTESIADFLERFYVEKQEYDRAAQFKDIVRNPQNYKKKFELFLIVEKSSFPENMLEDLNSLPPRLSPLNVTIVLIDNLASLVDNTWRDIETALVRKMVTV